VSLRRVKTALHKAHDRECDCPPVADGTAEECAAEMKKHGGHGCLDPSAHGPQQTGVRCAKVQKEIAEAVTRHIMEGR